jgi:ABC-type oligopeptide transport system substrate-binding subunit
MKMSKSPIAILLIVVVSLSSLVSFAGCSGGTKTATPEKKEEMRQKMIKNAERQKREG